MRIAERIDPLGYLRLRTLNCTAGWNPKAFGYFNPPEDINVFTAYHNHIARLSTKWRDDDYPGGLLPAMRLLSGDLSAAEQILDGLPSEPYEVDHGAGYCLVLAQRAMAHILPLSETLKERPVQTWLAGSQAQADVRAWLKEHRDKLRWE